MLYFVFKQKTAYEMRISDWSSDVCSSDLVGHVFRERHAVLRRLADGLVEQDRAADVLRQVGRGQQQLAVGAAVLLVVLDPDAGEALGDGAGGFVDGDDALARRDHGQGGFGKLFDTHVGKARGAAERPAIIARRYAKRDRKSDVEGKSVAVRVDL